MLRTGPPLGLDVFNLLRCSVVCQTMRRLIYVHVTHLELCAADMALGWWQPAKLLSVTAASLNRAAVPAVALLTQLRSLEIQHASSVDLQPLSALHRLTELHVLDCPASGLAGAPALSVQSACLPLPTS